MLLKSFPGSLRAMGERHSTLCEFIVADLLKFSPMFIQTEPYLDDRFYIANLVLVYNAYRVNRSLSIQLPPYASRHFEYFRLRYPDYFPPMGISGPSPSPASSQHSPSSLLVHAPLSFSSPSSFVQSSSSSSSAISADPSVGNLRSEDHRLISLHVYSRFQALEKSGWRETFIASFFHPPPGGRVLDRSSGGRVIRDGYSREGAYLSLSKSLSRVGQDLFKLLQYKVADQALVQVHLHLIKSLRALLELVHDFTSLPSDPSNTSTFHWPSPNAGAAAQHAVFFALQSRLLAVSSILHKILVRFLGLSCEVRLHFLQCLVGLHVLRLQGLHNYAQSPPALQLDASRTRVSALLRSLDVYAKEQGLSSRGVPFSLPLQAYGITPRAENSAPATVSADSSRAAPPFTIPSLTLTPALARLLVPPVLTAGIRNRLKKSAAVVLSPAALDKPFDTYPDLPGTIEFRVRAVLVNVPDCSAVCVLLRVHCAEEPRVIYPSLSHFTRSSEALGWILDTKLVFSMAEVCKWLEGVDELKNIHLQLATTYHFTQDLPWESSQRNQSEEWAEVDGLEAGSPSQYYSLSPWKKLTLRRLV